MPRSVNAVASKKKRKKILKQAKGYYGARSKIYTVAKNAVEKSMLYSYVGRKNKKKFFKSLWIQRINSALKVNNMTYSKFVFMLKKNNIILNKKSIADIATNHNQIFNNMVKKIMK